MTTNETTHTHEWTVNHDKGFTECPCGAQTTGVPHPTPDALTRLYRFVSKNASQMMGSDNLLCLIAEARKEMEALRLENERLRLSDAAHVADIQRSHEMHEGTRELLGRAQDALQRANDTAARLSGKSVEALRMGQQQGRVELAQEILAMNDAGAIRDVLIRIVDEDAGQ